MFKFRIVKNEPGNYKIAFYNSLSGLVICGVLQFLKKHSFARRLLGMTGFLLAVSTTALEWIPAMRWDNAGDNWLWGMLASLVLLVFLDRKSVV